LWPTMSGATENDEFLFLVVFGLAGIMCCMVLVGVWTEVERPISAILKKMKNNRKQRYYFIEMSRSNVRRDAQLERLRTHPQTQAVVVSVRRDVPPMYVRRDVPPMYVRRDMPPRYKDVIIRGEESEREEMFENLPSYEEAVENFERGVAFELVPPPLYTPRTNPLQTGRDFEA
jgi:hypothetical protein